MQNVTEERHELSPRRASARGQRHPRWLLLTGIGAAAGLVLAVVWSARFVDQVIGDNVANTLLGYDAHDAAIITGGGAILFALVTGLAGSFTACNIAVLGAAPQLTAAYSAGFRSRLTALLAPMGWLAAGILAVSAAYGAIAVLIGFGLPQANSGGLTLGAGIPPLITQSMVVFGVIGVGFCYLGLAAISVVPDPFANRPHWRLFTIGALVGGFLVGRPFGLFRRLVEHAVEQDNLAYGALAFSLQSLGNIVVMVLLVLLLVFGTRGRFPAWLAAQPRRAAALTAIALITFGVFTLVYWDIRVPALFGVGWFPTMPWNA